MEHKYEIEKIIPKGIAERYEELLKEEGFSDEEMSIRVENCSLWSKRRSYKNVGSRFYGAFKLILKNKKAFGDWVFARAKKDSRLHGACWAWNSKTKERIYLNNFELYIIISEYQINYFNSLNINAVDGTSNPEPFDKPIDYSNWESFDYLY